jgi:hypothetical protein
MDCDADAGYAVRAWIRESIRRNVLILLWVSLDCNVLMVDLRYSWEQMLLSELIFGWCG